MKQLTIKNGNGQTVPAFTALRNAIFHNLPAVVNPDTGKEFGVPSGSNGGNEQQALMYATERAQEILNSAEFIAFIQEGGEV